WQSLGVKADRIRLVGSIKFDPENVAARPDLPRAVLSTLGIDPTQPIFLGGSTHAGEEKILATTFLQLRKEFHELFLVVAPRHAERAREIALQLRQLGLPSILRSEATAPTTDNCLLLDTTGELRDWYSIATIVFIGKSLTAQGGQNPVEAIVANRPVVFGPHMENFAHLAAELVAAGGAVQVQDESELAGCLAKLLRDETSRARVVHQAQQVLGVHRGATTRTARLLEEIRPA
ncbi:MAG: 3-deoxy-D-manno-octulosonic acid transferase, partial [Chthoniobacterales bacterium]